MQTCPRCKEEKPDDQFYMRPDRDGKTQSYCKLCNNRNSLDRKRALKQQAINYKGGKCERCGYSKCNSALEFHHLDPSQKDFNLAKQRATSWEKNKERICAELDKCIMICANCHRELHAEMVDY